MIPWNREGMKCSTEKMVIIVKLIALQLWSGSKTWIILKKVKYLILRKVKIISNISNITCNKIELSKLKMDLKLRNNLMSWRISKTPIVEGEKEDYQIN